MGQANGATCLRNWIAYVSQWGFFYLRANEFTRDKRAIVLQYEGLKRGSTTPVKTPAATPVMTTPALSLTERLRSPWRGKTRVFLAWAFVASIVALVRVEPGVGAVGVCLLGASLRFWASGFLRKDRRPAVGGPYGFVRNPLYLGTYLMATACFFCLSSPLAGAIGGAVFSALYWSLYWVIITDEEHKLDALFGAPYHSYLRLVPRALPRLWPADAMLRRQINPEPGAMEFSWQLAVKNRAYEAYASAAGILAVLWGASALWARLGA